MLLFFFFTHRMFLYSLYYYLHLNLKIIIIFCLISTENTKFLRRATKKVGPLQARPSVIGLAMGACPLGTVPIRRATKKDLKKSKLLLNNIHPQNKAPPGSYVSSPLFSYLFFD